MPHSTVTGKHHIDEDNNYVKKEDADSTGTAEMSTKKKSRKGSIKDPFLPPCMVCTGKASGYHFGAITCEACKVFFRRSLAEMYVYTCKNGDDCEILPKRRKTCSACRVKKCYTVGMSKGGIQMGRYTLTKKSDCIRLAKGEALSREAAAGNSIIEGATGASPSNSRSQIPSNSRSQIPSKSRSQEEIIRYEKIISNLATATQKNPLFTSEFLESVQGKRDKAMEYNNLQESIFGTKHLSMEEYQELYKTTGLDIDGRRATFTNCYAQSAVPLTKFIAFVKSIPGFQDFCLEDKMTISREKNMGWYLIGILPLFDTDRYLFTCSDCGHTYVKADFAKAYDDHFVQLLFKSIRQLKALKLNLEETSLLQALSILSTDVVDKIKEPDIIELNQQLVLEVFVYYLEKNRPSEPLAIARIIQALTDLRDLRHAGVQIFTKLYQQYSDVSIPQLTFELMIDEFQEAFAQCNITE
jgi:hypothetical protein